jgi:hypothetical protein
VSAPAPIRCSDAIAARRIVEAEIGLPEACPWTIDQVREHKFWPELSKLP